MHFGNIQLTPPTELEGLTFSNGFLHSSMHSKIKHFIENILFWHSFEAL